MNFNLRLIVLGGMAMIVVVMWAMAWMSNRFEEVASGIAGLEAARFDQLSGVAVGTGGSFENHHRSGPAIAVGIDKDVLLIDAGRGVAEALREVSIPPWQPNHLVLTSLLPENTLGIDDLWISGWMGRREVPLQIYGPPGTAALVEGLRQAHASSAEQLESRWALIPAGGETPVTEVREATSFQVGKMTVRLELLTEADGGHVGVRVDAGEESMAFVTRATETDAVAALAHEVDWLWAGAVYGASLDAAEEAGAERIEMLRAEAGQQFLLEDVGGVAASARARGLVLVRLRPPPVFPSQYRNLVGESYRGAVVVPPDGEVITP